MAPLRIGVLGAARIAPAALIRPAKANAEVEVVAVAARDQERARAFALRHDIPHVRGDYEALLADADIDAVYNPLPNGLHGRWTIAALRAGKHVLCEKPFTANVEEAEEVAAVARESGRVVMEAFHYRYHPLVAGLLDVIDSGELGRIRRVDTWMCIPLLLLNDIRWNLGLAGGTLMDVGCYTIHLLRTLAGAEPEVAYARARERSPGVDRWISADMRFADGRAGSIEASMLSRKLLAVGCKVVGEDAEIRVFNPYAPQALHRVSVVRRDGSKRRLSFPRRPTYAYQLDAFAGAVLRGEPFPTGVDDAVANMAVIDAVYRAAGLAPRQPSPR